MKERQNARSEQGDAFLAGQESRDCFHFISDVGIRGIYLPLALGTAKFKQLKYIHLDLFYVFQTSMDLLIYVYYTYIEK